MKENSKIVTVKIIQVQFPNNPMNRFDIPKFRGYIANRYPKYYLIHNHLENGKLRYGYPLIQFKTIRKIPTIIGIGESIDILKNVFLDVEEIDIDGKRESVWEKSIKVRQEEFGQSKEFFNYKFVSPWMALKEENYETYKVMNAVEKQLFLRHLLRENFKTVSKGVQYWISNIDEIKVEGFFSEVIRNFKNNRMVCFIGKFNTNFLIPDHIGVGKQVARGLGTVERVNR